MEVTIKPIKISWQTLKDIAPYCPQSAEKYVPFLNDYLDHYGINTIQRAAFFLAQLAHESDQFKTAREYASGKAYEGRKDLGNTQKGDGVRFRGRGLIQLTGRYNYTLASKDLHLGTLFIDKPEIVETPKYAVLVSFWFWSKNNLNSYADNNDFIGATKRINGGTNGLKERQLFLERAYKVLESK